jgi:PAS domain S-box-containing protein
MLEAELFAFLENTADAVFAVREAGEICFWNHAAEVLFGHPADEVLGKTCSDVLHGIGALGTDVCHEGCAALRCAKPASHPPNFDLNVTTRSEERIWVNLSSISFLNRRTGRSLLVHLVRDISAQKKREEVFGRLVAISKEVATLEDTVAGAAPLRLYPRRSLRSSGCLRWAQQHRELPKCLASARRRLGIIFTTLTRNYGRIIALRR